MNSIVCQELFEHIIQSLVKQSRTGGKRRRRKGKANRRAKGTEERDEGEKFNKFMEIGATGEAEGGSDCCGASSTTAGTVESERKTQSTKMEGGRGMAEEWQRKETEQEHEVDDTGGAVEKGSEVSNFEKN